MKTSIDSTLADRPKGIPAMTGIRGLASLWVLLFHVQLNAGKYFGLVFLEQLPFLKLGWHAVDLFFMLSGFILMYAHERDFHTLRQPAITRFGKLRFTRIYPLNTAVLLLIGVIAISNRSFTAWMRATNDPADFSSGAFVRTLLLANRWFLQQKGSWNEPVWSLSLEIIGYALFPLLAYSALRLRRRTQAFAIAFASLAGFIYFSFVRHMLFTNMIGQIAIARMLCCFVVGIAVFRIWALTASDGKGWAPVVGTTALLGIAIACVVPGAELALNSLFALLLFSLAFQQRGITSLFSSAPMMFLGRISFPLYLIHGIAFWWLRFFMITRLGTWSHGETLMLLAAGLAGCLLLSTVLNYAVEKPAHNLGRRWAAAGSGRHSLVTQKNFAALPDQSIT
jgi:peptidoglycan/LPS O-acetylase OafA/YrhL